MFPSSICPGHKGIRSRSLTVSGSGKRRPAQSLGGNYLLIASVSQKHHPNLSWDSRFFFQQISTLGASFPSQLLNLEVVLPLLPPSPCPLLNGFCISSPALTLTSSSPFVALHSNLRCIGRAPGNRMYLAGRRVLMSAKCREMQPRAANWVINL